mgnify:CR=1 FL=1
MIRLTINNNYIKLDFDKERDKDVERLDKFLVTQINPLDPKRMHVASFYKYHTWDGRITIYDPKEHLLPTGLYKDLREALAKFKDMTGMSFDLRETDVRAKPFDVEVPDHVVLKGDGVKTLDLREHQLDSVKAVFKQQRGLLDEATNAGKCLTGDTMILTQYGYRRLDSIVSGMLPADYLKKGTECIADYTSNIQLVNQEGSLEKPDKAMFNGYKQTYRIYLRDGRSLTATGNHPLLVKRGNVIDWVQVKDLKKYDDLVNYKGYATKSLYHFDTKGAFLLGATLADGDTLRLVTDRLKYLDKVHSNVLAQAFHTVESFNYGGKGLLYQEHQDGYLIDPADSSYKLTHLFYVLLNASWGTRTSFMAGYLKHALNGGISTFKRLEVAQFIQRLGLSVGLMPKLCPNLNENLDDEFKNEIKDTYELVFDIEKVATFRKLYDHHKLTPIVQSDYDNLETYTDIVSIKSKGIEPVYDLQMPETHSFIANGVVSHNSSIVYTAFKLLEPKLGKWDKALLLAPNLGVMSQMHKNLEAYLDQEVGIWGGGEKNLDPKFICASTMSIYKGMQKPKIELTRKADKLLERMVTKHMPIVLTTSSARNNLKLYAGTYIPKYKYEEEDKAELQKLARVLQSDREVKKYFKDLAKDYQKMLEKKDRKGYKKYQETLDLLDSVKVVFVDECHFATAESYTSVLNAMPNARMRIGMSGTIDQKSEFVMKSLRSTMGEILYSVDNEYMIDKGYSSKPYIKMVSFNKPDDLEMQVHELMVRERIPKGQQALFTYQQSYRLGIIENEVRNKLVARLAIKLSTLETNMATLIMVNSIEHGENIMKFLKEAKASYAYVHGSDGSAVRADVLDKVKSGEIKILIATKIFEAGIDLPNLKYFISCSGGKSYVSNLQRIGRLLRVSDKEGQEKHKVYIYDIVDRNSKYLYKQAIARKKYYEEEGFSLI